MCMNIKLNRIKNFQNYKKKINYYTIIRQKIKNLNVGDFKLFFAIVLNRKCLYCNCLLNIVYSKYFRHKILHGRR